MKNLRDEGLQKVRGATKSTLNSFYLIKSHRQQLYNAIDTENGLTECLLSRRHLDIQWTFKTHQQTSVGHSWRSDRGTSGSYDSTEDQIIIIADCYNNYYNVYRWEGVIYCNKWIKLEILRG